MTLSTAAINAAANALSDLCDVGASAPRYQMATDATFTTIIVDWELDGTAAWTAAVGGITNPTGAPITATAASTNTATHQRWLDGNGAVVDGANAICDAIVDLVDGGTGAGDIQFATDAGFTNVILTYTLDATAFGAAVAGVATANGFSKSATPTADGIIAYWRLRDGDGTAIDDQALPAGIAVTNGVAVTFNSFTYTAQTFAPALASSIDFTNAASYALNAATALTQPAS